MDLSDDELTYFVTFRWMIDPMPTPQTAFAFFSLRLDGVRQRVRTARIVFDQRGVIRRGMREVAGRGSRIKDIHVGPIRRDSPSSRWCAPGR